MPKVPGQVKIGIRLRIVDAIIHIAQDMMKLYAEYGASGIASKSQSIANLSVTQAVALLEIPAEEREKFAEQNNAKDMTIRELKEELGKFDRVTAKKMMTEVNKSMHAVETKVRKKLTA